MATAPSGGMYIGKTELTLAERISSHKRGNCPAIRAALDKYGDAVKWAIIAEPPLHCLDEFERFYIRELSPEYNCTDGGDGGSPSPDVCARISEKLTGIKRPPEFCAKISERCLGKPSPVRGIKHTPEAVANMTAAARRRKKPKPFTDEHRANLSAANKGKPWSKARREAQNNRGK